MKYPRPGSTTMSRRGRCRCGNLLVFHRSPEGYKMRCPQCLAVVRLCLDAAGKSKPPRKRPKALDFDINSIGASQFLDMELDGHAEPGSGVI
jgi:hypothetical protein